ncbi:hypothetical protein SAMN05444161_6012 [Rhizobiales bacterium GAS191]|jgi:crotonobetainyl-CoA:carnitine CoA-transferase CaiB-like acyl-CoA transferase|nr:hypothetical protein SAMN05519103_05187 [Rhizobiales bacterium GAS113]SEE51506.1 hypothetical protein SAMN05444161_6012 [Rhizobiales bacterium GAS191]
MRAPKSWADKLEGARPPEVKPVPIDIAGMKKGEIMLVPSPRLIDAFMRAIPKGTGMDVKSLRRQLARQNGAEVTCPITTGFHLRVVAEAAFEAHQRGEPLGAITPFWRVLDEEAATSKKLSFGVEFIRKRRREEGLGSETKRRGD